MNRFRKTLTVCFGTVLSLAITSRSEAAFHLWQISEVYSNASGSVQFVELFTDQSSQQFVNLTSFKSNANTYSFPAQLPADSANKHFLIATPGYAALPGVPAPDFILPTNNFFSTTADTLTLNGAQFPSLTFTSGQLPTDGVHSLDRAYLGPFTAPPAPTVDVNSPTNFSGVTGTVPEPSAIVLAALSVGILWKSRRRLARG
jgi:serralysin